MSDTNSVSSLSGRGVAGKGFRRHLAARTVSEGDEAASEAGSDMVTLRDETGAALDQTAILQALLNF